MNWRAVLFDLDGTLVDSYGAISASVNHVRAASGLAPLPEAEVKRFVGLGPEHLLAHTVPGTNLQDALAGYRAHHATVMLQKTRLLSGAYEVVTGLHRAGMRVAVCSNKLVGFSRALLEHLGLAECVDVVLGPEDVERPKPAPDMLLAALARLKVQTGEALYVGDMVVDIETARGAGVAVWVVATGSEERSRLQEAKPDRLLGELREVLSILAR
jgi:phosphoglycolate phosphatase